MRRLLFFLTMLALATAGACKSPPVDQTPRTISSQHFRLDYYGLDSAIVQRLLHHMETNRTRVMTDLLVDTMPTVHIIMHTDSSFNARWGTVIQRSGVAFQVQGLANGVNEVHVYGPWAMKYAGGLSAVVLHEFVHCATLQFALLHGDSSHAVPVGTAPTTEHAQDRWLAEAIALYEANQSTDLNWVRRMRNGEYPTLRELSDPSNSLIYGVGYRLMEYVRLKWGAEGVSRLILAHGDVQRALNVSPTTFEDGWYDWVVTRYLIVKPTLFGSSRYSRRAH